MANPITFYSRSAQKVDPVNLEVSTSLASLAKLSKGVKAKSKSAYHQPLVIFLGDAESAFMELGEKLGFSCLSYDKGSDLTYVIQAKVVVAHCMENSFKRYVEVLNFAVSYGIPTVWVHPMLLPGRWVWSFRYCLVGANIQSIDLWRKICQEIM